MIDACKFPSKNTFKFVGRRSRTLTKPRKRSMSGWNVLPWTDRAFIHLMMAHSTFGPSDWSQQVFRNSFWKCFFFCFIIIDCFATIYSMRIVNEFSKCFTAWIAKCLNIDHADFSRKNIKWMHILALPWTGHPISILVVLRHIPFGNCILTTSSRTRTTRIPLFKLSFHRISRRRQYNSIYCLIYSSDVWKICVHVQAYPYAIVVQTMSRQPSRKTHRREREEKKKLKCSNVHALTQWFNT